MESLGFVLGLVVYYAPFRISVPLLLLAYVVSPLNHAFYKRLFFFLVGLGWGMFHQAMTASQGLPVTFPRTPVEIEGIISSMPKQIHHRLQFQFDLTTYQHHPANGTLWLRCYASCPALHIGEGWRFSAKLRATTNPHHPSQRGFNHWIISNHLQGLGYFNPQTALRLHTPTGFFWSFQSWRSKWADTLKNVLPKDDPTLGILQGLTLGLSSHISKAQWDLFRRTGTTHLVVISGEHIALIMGGCFIIMRFIGSRLGALTYRFPAPRMASLLAWLMGGFYACAAGLGAPVERAWIASSVMLLRYMMPLVLSVWQAWRIALCLVLFIEPHALFTPGFYLSFIAVAILILIETRYTKLPKFPKMLLLQLACLIGLLPVTLFYFSYGALNGFFVNLIAIPWVGMLVVPWALLGTLLIQFHPWRGWLWIPQHATSLLLHTLAWCDHLQGMNIEFSVTHVESVLFMLIGLSLWITLPVKRLYGLYSALIGLGVYLH